MITSVNSLIDLDSVHKQVEERGFAIIHPAGLLEICELARQEYVSVMKATPLRSSKESFNYRDLKNGPWRKQAISSTNGIGEPYAQFLQTTYFDHIDSPYKALKAIFSLTISLRNRLMGRRDDFANDPVNDGFWNACRVHHYPRGGGFMIMHRDTFFPAALGDHAFYQLLVPFSQMGRDFQAGGGVVIDKFGVKHNTDELGGMGSILVYDGRTQHGVEDVDPDQLVDFESRDGRLAIICNPYLTVRPTRVQDQ